jgi:hypothetical protein
MLNLIQYFSFPSQFPLFYCKIESISFLEQIFVTYTGSTKEMLGFQAPATQEQNQMR